MNDVVRYRKICQGRRTFNLKASPAFKAATTFSLIKDLSYYNNIKFQSSEPDS